MRHAQKKESVESVLQNLVSKTLKLGTHKSAAASSHSFMLIRQMAAVVIIKANSASPGQLSLLPSAAREMSTSQSAVMLCGWGVKAGMVHSTCG